jgi:hypothetical protein
VKPEEWDERAMIPDEADVKSAGYDDIPEMIKDPEAGPYTRPLLSST